MTADLKLINVPLTSKVGVENQRMVINKHARIQCNESAKKQNKKKKQKNKTKTKTKPFERLFTK